MTLFQILAQFASLRQQNRGRHLRCHNDDEWGFKVCYDMDGCRLGAKKDDMVLIDSFVSPNTAILDPEFMDRSARAERPQKMGSFCEDEAAAVLTRKATCAVDIRGSREGTNLYMFIFHCFVGAWTEARSPIDGWLHAWSRA
eukprot:CAMPEP_0181344836 /NCGR_PEP_ID=MMETSP1101-20121128/32414_1 /TAXON_ID=46948 /ORGANISM="Rhodomonas abbreviata, Strain Caron Lab Isolate" /LENGTH=141 /DNA_ID=CAMNT_0023456723 /DNA_START=98 /DNA_END=524 /DNA_ORIENTATION=-